MCRASSLTNHYNLCVAFGSLTLLAAYVSRNVFNFRIKFIDTASSTNSRRFTVTSASL